MVLLMIDRFFRPFMIALPVRMLDKLSDPSPSRSLPESDHPKRSALSQTLVSKRLGVECSTDSLRGK